MTISESPRPSTRNVCKVDLQAVGSRMMMRRRLSPYKNEILIPLLAVLVNNLNQTVFHLVHSFYKLPTIKVDFLSVILKML